MFKPMYDLESLSEADRQQYYLDACQHYGLPSELNLLAFMWMDGGDGKRNLVLYAKKGATDMLREIHQISLTKITKDEGPGYVSWIAEGRRNDGRTEIAVGTAATEGLKGQALANAVMIAHTRANRRLTLQFVGGGLLDESELNQTTTDINRAGTSLASMATLPAPQPTVQPSQVAGKDVTPLIAPETIKAGLEITQSLADSLKPLYLAAQNPPKEGVSLHKIAPEPFSGGSIVPEKVAILEDISPTLVQIEPAPKKRHRRSKAEMAAARQENAVIESGVTTTEAEISPEKYFQTKEPIFLRDVPEIAVNQAIDAVVEKAAMDLMPEYKITHVDEVVTPEPPRDLPNSEQLKAWRAQLFQYTNKILPDAGMVPTENVGGTATKVRKYAASLFPETPDLKNLTNTQWKLFFERFEEAIRIGGPKLLVELIDAVAAR